jgi:hypothetical protein
MIVRLRASNNLRANRGRSVDSGKTAVSAVPFPLRARENRDTTHKCVCVTVNTMHRKPIPLHGTRAAALISDLVKNALSPRGEAHEQQPRTRLKIADI